MPVYFIHSKQVDRGKIILRDRLAHHLRDVLRLQKGETLLLVDERPKRYTARLVESQPAQLTLEVLQEESPPSFPLPALHLGIGLLKGEKFEWVLQKATELGTARITPLVTERAVIRPKADRVAHQQERWNKIVLEAAQQSGRWTLPILDPPAELLAFLTRTSGYGVKLIFWEGIPSESPRHEIVKAIASAPPQGAVLIGPEGGWEKTEVDAARAMGYQALSLGPRILRAETAAVAALAVVQYEIEGRGHGDH
ncbi:MAG: 16S rRNA (uracil(1498)-N(3))-methyltransferase [Candidatus Manganitrophaceae bacterium]|nr:MAG: 16S rRNA (uracil(1498)-N(3))-methyltransferase [Candidatus Manganitrophaceae bacterium]